MGCVYVNFRVLCQMLTDCCSRKVTVLRGFPTVNLLDNRELKIMGGHTFI